MSNGQIDKFPMPELGWVTIKKIIRAYYAKRDQESVTVQEVAQAANLSRPLVSSNNNFLKALGILQQDSYKLTEFGVKLAIAIVNDDPESEQRCIKGIVDGSPPLKKLVDTVVARGEISTKSFSTEARYQLGISEADRRARFVSTIQEILVESRMINLDGDMLRPSTERRREDKVPPPPPPSDNPPGVKEVEVHQGLKQVPIPVGPDSVWYVEISQNASQEQIKKFLDVQRLIFDLKD